MKRKLFLAVFICTGLAVVLYKGFVSERPAAVSEEKAKAIASSTYNGNVQSIEWNKEKHAYEIILENSKGTYALSVDGKSEKIGNVTMLEQNQKEFTLEEAKTKIARESKGVVTSIQNRRESTQPEAEAIVEKNGKKHRFLFDLKTGTTLSSDEIVPANTALVPAPSTVTSISEKTAKEAATKVIQGNVTNVETIQTEAGGQYKVTIENKEGGAHVYVQSATADVSSIYRFTKTKKEAPSATVAPPASVPSARAESPNLPKTRNETQKDNEDDGDDEDDGYDENDDDQNEQESEENDEND